MAKDKQLSEQQKLLIKWRKRKGFTQQDIAAKSGLSIHLIKAIEIGRRYISYRSAVKLARAMGHAPARLIEEQD